MTINSYLTNIANAAITRDQEKLAIQKSINTLQLRLKSHFGTQMTDSYVFGSYGRGTILPRNMDANSDVDYIVVFSEGGLRPQSYLDRLRRFAELNYQRSDIEQSNPTMVLDLNHIRFELVPAIQSWFGGLQIPARASDANDWQGTDPKGFNEILSAANQTHKNMIKPLVRLVKYWNVVNGSPFESYSLEQKVAGHNFGLFGFFNSCPLEDYFFDYIAGMETSIFAPNWQRDAVARAKKIASEAKLMERSGNAGSAELHIKKLLPPVNGLFA